MRYETYRKRGRGWEYLGERDANSMRSAALHTSYVHNIKVIAVRPAGSRDKKYIYRFKYVASLASGV